MTDIPNATVRELPPHNGKRTFIIEASRVGSIKVNNNGLDETFTDNGYGKVSGNPDDNGKFKTPTLRNIEFTAPYMHDGRYATLEDVANHYSTGLKASNTVDPLMKKISQGGIQLTTTEKQDLIAFLKTFSDAAYNTNTAFKE